MSQQTPVDDEVSVPSDLTTSIDNKSHLLKMAKNERTGKKISISKRIPIMNELMSMQGSRTTLKIHEDKLREKFAEAREIHNKLMGLFVTNEPTDKKGIMWIEDLEIIVDQCLGEVQQYLEDHQDDPPSIWGSEENIRPSQAGITPLASAPRYQHIANLESIHRQLN